MTRFARARKAPSMLFECWSMKTPPRVVRTDA